MISDIIVTPEDKQIKINPSSARTTGPEEQQEWQMRGLTAVRFGFQKASGRVTEYTVSTRNVCSVTRPLDLVREGGGDVYAPGMIREASVQPNTEGMSQFLRNCPLS